MSLFQLYHSLIWNISNIKNTNQYRYAKELFDHGVNARCERQYLVDNCECNRKGLETGRCDQGQEVDECTWCSSAKRENLNHFHILTFSCFNYVKRISLTSLTHATKKSLEKQRSNANVIMTKTQLALRARTQVRSEDLDNIAQIFEMVKNTSAGEEVLVRDLDFRTLRASVEYVLSNKMMVFNEIN